MADFCQQCSIALFDEDFRDTAEVMPREAYTDGSGYAVICEGCGYTVVDFDGKCIADWCQEHGTKEQQEKADEREDSAGED